MLLFDRDLMPFHLADVKRVPLHPPEVEVGRRVRRVCDVNLLAVRRDLGPAGPGVPVELDPRLFGVADLESESHGNPPQRRPGGNLKLPAGITLFHLAGAI